MKVLEVVEEFGGQCQICGTEMKEDIVRCGACRTPHHRDCWEYLGRCSTYGCRGWKSQTPNTLRAWMDEIADDYRDGHIQRQPREPGHYALIFNRRGVRCMLEGKRSRDGRRVWFRTSANPAGPIPSTLSLTLDDNGIVLHPREAIDGRTRLREFFLSCIDLVDHSDSSATRQKSA